VDLANSVSASHLESLLVFARTNSPIRNPIANVSLPSGSRPSFKPSTGRLKHFNVRYKFCPQD
jgi:hypothetical protein